MANYPLICAVALAGLVVFAWWRTRSSPACSAAALWTLGSAAASYAFAQLFMSDEAQPSLRHVPLGSTGIFHSVTLFPAPSGTAALAGSVVTGLFLIGRRYGLAGTVAAVAIAVFQIGYEQYSERDVLAAALLGLAIVLGGFAALQAPLTRLTASLAGGSRRRGSATPGRSSAAGERARP